MFLLFLIGLGTADVNAQVRIGGNAAPNGAAVLDLNATDAATGTKGLALPRVNLTSNTMQITSGVANLPGMLVYNTTATLGAGIYFWSGSTWVKANLPATSASDSGRLLMSNGSSFTTVPRFMTLAGTVDTIYPLTVRPAVSWTLLFDTIVSLNADIPPGQFGYVYAPGINASDLCYTGTSTFWAQFTNNGSATLIMTSLNGQTIRAGYSYRVRCFRPSF